MRIAENNNDCLDILQWFESIINDKMLLIKVCKGLVCCLNYL